MLLNILKSFLPDILKWIFKKFKAHQNKRQDKKEEKVYQEKIYTLTSLQIELEKAIEARDEKEIIRVHMLINSIQ